MYVRQLAYFAAVPDGSKLSRREQREGKKEDDEDTIIIDSDDEEDNLNKVPQETAEIPFPEIPMGAEYLLSFFYSAGCSTQTGMGLVPLSWQEIEAWVRCNGLDDSVTPWELQVVRKLSEAYSAEYSRASDPKRRMPFKPEVKVEEIDHEAVANQVMNVFNRIIEESKR